MATVLDFIQRYKVADISSILGLMVSILGFALTLLSVAGAREAARQASKSAETTRKSIRLLDNIVDFTLSIEKINEIKMLQRNKSWHSLVEKYSGLRVNFIAIRSSSISLSVEQKQVLQSAIDTLSSLEQAVEKSLENPNKLSSARFNAILSKHVDGLTEIVTQLKNRAPGV